MNKKKHGDRKKTEKVVSNTKERKKERKKERRKERKEEFISST